MKCIKLDQKVQRVTDSEAEKLLKQGWRYCPKTDWKKSIQSTHIQANESNKSENTKQISDSSKEAEKILNKKVKKHKKSINT